MKGKSGFNRRCACRLVSSGYGAKVAGVVMACLLGAHAVAVAEVRVWTDVTGRAISAELVAVYPTSVSLRLANGQLAIVDKAKLSAADLTFLQQAPPPQSKATLGAKSGPAFFQAPVDPKLWIKNSPPKSFDITGYDFETQIETPHFIVSAAKKVKGSHIEACAEAAERLYHQMAQQLKCVEGKFENKRMTVWLTPNKEEHLKVGEALAPLGEVSFGWSDSTISTFRVSPESADKFSLFRASRGFRTDYEPNSQGNIRWTKRLHFMASSICSECMPSFSDDTKSSTSMFETCYAYYVEGLIAGKIETKIRFEGDASKVEGFDKGWEGSVKRLIAKGLLKPSIEKFTTMQASDAEPVDLGFGYGLLKFIFADAGRTARFNEMLGQCRTDSKTPTAQDYATALVSGPPEALDREWLEFMTSPAF